MVNWIHQLYPNGFYKLETGELDIASSDRIYLNIPNDTLYMHIYYDSATGNNLLGTMKVGIKLSLGIENVEFTSSIGSVNTVNRPHVILVNTSGVDSTQYALGLYISNSTEDSLYNLKYVTNSLSALFIEYSSTGVDSSNYHTYKYEIYRKI